MITIGFYIRNVDDVSGLKTEGTLYIVEYFHIEQLHHEL